MGFFGSLIRFVFNAVLLLAGMIVVIIIMASVITSSSLDAGDPRLSITTGPLRGRSPLDPGARALYPVLQARVDEINTPVSHDPSGIAFKIEAGQTAQAVAQDLRAIGLISDARLFGQLLRYNGLDTRLRAGTYNLRRNMTMTEIGAVLYQAYSGPQVVTIPEGWRAEQVAEHLIRQNIMDGSLFLMRVRAGTIVDHYLLADRPSGQSYEGYLFPDTYYLPENAAPEDLITQMLDNLASKLPPNFLALAQRQGLTFHEVLTLASIVEREAVLAAERPLIASVYLNRLAASGSGSYLQADPTVQYAMGYQADTNRWWKAPVRLEEYSQVDSPYNTYLYPGLPPGPIANPGLDSIMAVLHPAKTDYLFFVCQRPRCEGGAHVFAKTYQEHLRNVAVYWEQ